MESDSTALDICLESPLCYRFAVDYDVKILKLTSIDLYDPDIKDKDQAWTTITPPYNAQGEAAAVAALTAKAVTGQFDLNLCSDGCDCKLSGTWSAWSNWSEVKISAGFSVPGPGGA